MIARFRHAVESAVLLFVTIGAALPAAGADVSDTKAPRTVSPLADRVLMLLSPEAPEREQAADWLAGNWDDRAIPMLIELLRFMHDESTRRRAIDLLQGRTGERHGGRTDEWQSWLWNRPPLATSALADFKSGLYRLIDPAFENYFAADRIAKIRLDEVVWGGVAQDGIPPLRNPKMISAGEAEYLADSDVVFAISIDEDFRAYPKRIIAWHEMFVDRVAAIPVMGVYCTLCGTMILYETTHEGVAHDFGTSGFLFRSNKLMYDQATQSLWNTLWGQPVIGPLAEEGFRLKRRPIVTTTWGEWRRRHPETRVLSRNTGHRRDYSEGAAYRDYFATDQLIFGVPKLDDRMRNKAEVLALIFDEAPTLPLAIAADYLSQHALYQSQLGPVAFVVVTDSSGANRVYESGGVRFARWDGDESLVDESGEEWTLTESNIRSAQGRELRRLPAHRAFWFGWYSAHPDTALIR